jgi:PKD domain
VSPSGLPGARLLELVRNPGPAPVTTSVQVGDMASGVNKSDLGSDTTTAVRDSASGAPALDANDNWMVTSDNAVTDGDFALAHVFDGPGGADRHDFVALSGTDAQPADNLAYRWNNVAIAPGQTAAFISYEIQQAVPSASTTAEVSAASQQARNYQANPLGQIYASMSDAEIAAVRNWEKPKPGGAAIGAPAKVTDAKSATLSASAVASSLAGHCQGLAFAWNLGDGTTASGPTVTRRFAKGTRTVSLTASNSCGESTTVSKQIKVIDATRPSGTLKVPKSVSLRTLLRGMKVKFKPTERESVTFSLTLPSSLTHKASAARISRRVVKRRLTLVGGKSKTLRLKPSRGARANLRRLKRRGVKRTKLALKVSLKDTAKLKRTLKTRRIKLRF